LKKNLPPQSQFQPLPPKHLPKPLKLAEFRWVLAGKNVPPPNAPSAPSPKHPLAGLNFEQLGAKWLVTLVDVGEKTKQRRCYSIRVVGKALENLNPSARFHF